MSFKKFVLLVSAFVSFSSTAALAQSSLQLLPPPPPRVGPVPPPPMNGGWGLQQFARDEQDALAWNQKYNAAPSGSWDESYARDQRAQAVQRAVNDIGPQAFQGMRSADIEAFADQITNKYNAAPSGSVIEGMYRQIQQVAYASFTQALQQDVNYLSNDWRRLLEIATQLDQKYNAAASGSTKEKAYDQARRLAYQVMPNALSQELYQYQDFRQIEQLALYFDQQYNAAPSGSLKEGVFKQMQRQSYDAALQKVNSQIYSYPTNALLQLQDEYNSKYNAASSGSAKEAYFRQVRDLARSLLSQGH